MYEALSTALLVFAFLGVAALTTWLLNKYTSRKLSSWYVLILVWIGWYFSFIVVVLVPLDISSTSHKECEVTETSCTEPWINVHRNSLIYIWNTVYWTTYILCWTGYPFIQSYVTDGSFTVGERIKSAIKENLIFYGICLGVVIVLFLWMIAKTQGNYHDIYATAIAAANAWGLFLLISLLGYGLVEIPRKIWQESDREMTMKFYQFDVVNKRQDFEDAKVKYYETLKLIKKYSEKTRSTDAFRPYIDTIENECPPEYRSIKSGEGDFELRYDKIVQLRKRLQFVIHELRRSQGLYQVRLERAFALEDIMRSGGQSKWTIDWSFKPKRKGYFAKQLNTLEFLWKVYLETRVFKFLSLVCVLLSLAVVWSEVVFSIPYVNLSIFSILLNVKTEVPFLWQWFVVSIPVTYITICACWSLFQFRFFNFYRLVPHQETDANSLLFSAAYVCRLIAPIAYNFLLMVHNDTTAFYDVLGQMNLTPFLGNEYNVYFPMILIILCIANYFNLFSKFILTCCIKRFHRFVFEEGISDKPIAQGKEILKHERELWERGINSSHVNVNTEAQERNGRFPDFKKIFHPRASSQDTENLLGRQKRPYGTSAPEDPYADFNNGIV